MGHAEVGGTDVLRRNWSEGKGDSSYECRHEQGPENGCLSRL